MASIYLTINLINGKKYIGSDSKDSPNYLGSGTLIKQAIKKYGKENFKKIILEQCDISILYDREFYWIKYYDCVNSSEYYNLADGGKGGNRLTNENSIKKWKNNTPNLAEISKKRKGKTYEEIYGNTSQNEKEKRKTPLLGTKRPKEICKKISDSLKGNKPWNKGLTKKTDKRVLSYSIKSKSSIPFKKYILIQENGEIKIFIGKNELRTYITKINEKTKLKERINLNNLIKYGEDKNHKISHCTIKRNKI